MRSLDLALEAARDATVEVCASVMGSEPDFSISDHPADSTDQVLDQVFIGLASDDMAVQLGLVADKSACAAFTRALLQIPGNEEVSQQDVVDGVGELANIIAGGVKSRLSVAYSGLCLGLPVWVAGQESMRNRVSTRSKIAMRSFYFGLNGHAVAVIVMVKERSHEFALSR